MIQPIIVEPRNDSVEAVQFLGGAQAAWDIAAWLQQAIVGTPDEGTLSMNYTEIYNGPSNFSFYVGGSSHEIEYGDYIIKDGQLFSVCKRQDFGLRYVQAGIA